MVTENVHLVMPNESFDMACWLLALHKIEFEKLLVPQPKTLLCSLRGAKSHCVAMVPRLLVYHIWADLLRPFLTVQQNRNKTPLLLLLVFC